MISESVSQVLTNWISSRKIESRHSSIGTLLFESFRRVQVRQTKTRYGLANSPARRRGRKCFRFDGLQIKENMPFHPFICLLFSSRIRIPVYGETVYSTSLNGTLRHIYPLSVNWNFMSLNHRTLLSIHKDYKLLRT